MGLHHSRLGKWVEQLCRGLFFFEAMGGYGTTRIQCNGARGDDRSRRRQMAAGNSRGMHATEKRSPAAEVVLTVLHGGRKNSISDHVQQFSGGCTVLGVLRGETHCDWLELEISRRRWRGVGRNYEKGASPLPN